MIERKIGISTERSFHMRIHTEVVIFLFFIFLSLSKYLCIKNITRRGGYPNSVSFYVCFLCSGNSFMRHHTNPRTHLRPPPPPPTMFLRYLTKISCFSVWVFSMTCLGDFPSYVHDIRHGDMSFLLLTTPRTHLDPPRCWS